MLLLLLLALHRPHPPLVPRHGALVALLLFSDCFGGLQTNKCATMSVGRVVSSPTHT